jgi:two-component system NtrC family sensor kinase
MKIGFRTTQLLGYTLVVAVMTAFTIYAGFSFISETVIKEAKLRVQMDLNSAWSAYEEENAQLQMAVSMAAQHETLRKILTHGGNLDDVTAQLRSFKTKYGLDYLTLIDNDGVVLTGSENEISRIQPTRRDPIINDALSGKARNGTVVISYDDLALESNELAERAYIPLVQTERAKPTDKTMENRGMSLEAATPILGDQDSVLGAMFGGILLNRKSGLVDRIRNVVFGDQIYEGKPLGTVTIFLWDTRIATNVIKADSTRAIGTRVSDEVYETVLGRGERFADRAFVVNDWYMSAYDPIKDPNGNIIGILYVGLLEKKYLDYKSSLVMKFLGICLGALLFSVGLALYLSGTIRRPILRLVRATTDLSDGKLDTRVDDKQGIREMTELARSFNSMAESLETHNRQLQEASQALEKAYTEADEKNRAYLEMLGFVTHELKSPLASIVFAIGSLRDRILGSLNEEQESILKAASSSADYLHTTIINYLNLSRIEEGELKLKLRTISLRSEMIDPVIERLSEMASDNKMRVTCNVPTDAKATCDHDLLMSVFQNLLSNAIKYGKEGGKITIGMEQETDAGFLSFNVFNEGIGFTKEEAGALFGKFSRFGVGNYGTKSGTGLGLFVTKRIVEKHGGRIWAQSEPGKWANFIFTISTRIQDQEGQTTERS